MKSLLKKLLVLSIFVSVTLPVFASAKIADDGKTVEVHYTGKLADGRIFDSSAQREPLEFTLGNGQMLKDFEQAIIGMKRKEEKTIRIPASAAYGEVDEEKIFKVSRDKMPADVDIKVGTTLNMRSAKGRYLVRIIDVIGDDIWVDANHVLAGKDLIFDIKLVSVKNPKNS